MTFSDFTLKRVVIPYYEVKSLPLLLTSVIMTIGLIGLLFFSPYIVANFISNQISFNFFDFIWIIITFLFLVVLVFSGVYMQLRKFCWRHVKRNLIKNDYVFENDYGEISEHTLTQKILADYPSIEIDPEKVGLVVILYKDKYIIHQKFWGIK